MTEPDNKQPRKEDVAKELEEALSADQGSKVARFALAALSGLIPFAGGVVSGAASAWSEADSENFQRILKAWLKLQEEEIQEIGKTLIEVMSRLDQNDENIRKRIEGPEYMSLLKKCFRDWSAAESETKRVLVRNLLVNAASPGTTEDDVIRLFIDWIDKYSELHFKVISAIYNRNGISRGGIWAVIDGRKVAENSSEADLFKIVIHDLSVGHIVRQHRPVDRAGNFVPAARKPRVPKGFGPKGYTSAFDTEKPYELTGLGQQFVHFTMGEMVTKLANG